MKVLLTASLVTFAGGLFGATAHAGSGGHLWHSRDIGAGILVEGCENVNDGFRCASMFAQEYYDVKGTFEYSEIYARETTYLATGQGFRSLRCFLVRGLVKVLGGAHAVSFDTAVDVDTAGCDLWRYWSDYASGTTTPDGFSGIVHVFADLTGRHSLRSENRSGASREDDAGVPPEQSTFGTYGSVALGVAKGPLTSADHAYEFRRRGWSAAFVRYAHGSSRLGRDERKDDRNQRTIKEKSHAWSQVQFRRASAS